MIIKKLTIVNIGLFKGKHVFDLSPEISTETKKPIILIGGKNGTGKTTLFESVLLCLYGPNFQGNKLGKKDYDTIISGKIHHIGGTAVHTVNAYVEIEFEYSHLGKIDQYIVRRSWLQESKKITETLEVMVNNKVLTDLEVDQWQDFLSELIPPGISKMFFFDGEKIQHLAEDHENNEQIRDSFKALLGIDIVEKLKIDLRNYITRNSKQIGAAEIRNRIAELKKEISSLDENLDQLTQERASKQNIYSHTLGEIERQEMNLAHNGGSFANKRDEFKQEKMQLEAEISSVENQIRELCHSTLPFAFTPTYCRKLREHLIEEDKYLEWKAAEKAIDSKTKEVDDKIRSPTLWESLEIPVPVQEEIILRLSNLISSTFVSSSEFENYKTIHNLSSQEKQKIISWIDISLNQIPNQLKNYTNKLESLNQRFHEVEESLIRVPDDDLISPYVKKLNDLNKELGQSQEQISMIDKEINRINIKKTELTKKLNEEIEEINKSEKLTNKLEIAGKVQDIIDEYILELRKEKIIEFGNVFLKSFNELARKNNLIQNIKIDESDFSMILYDSEGRKISKRQLSAGEKQIYAISMLWAFTLTSGRQLPFIIDTPLGRLDSDHRGTLINSFFPFASDQMIILSTDTEIDKKYFETLGPYISKIYHLEYSQHERLTKTTEGYFWKKENEGMIYEV